MSCIYDTLPGVFCRKPQAMGGIKLHQQVRALGRRVHSLAWTQDGGRLASAAADKTVRIWNIKLQQAGLYASVFLYFYL
jgi:WD40 repeat protein